MGRDGVRTFDTIQRMAPDKYSATWVSHSSINDFLTCPRAYYLNNVYKDPKTNRKISIINPHLALGTAVHNTLESLVEERIPVEERAEISLADRFEAEWEKVKGINGGFIDQRIEDEMKARGQAMVAYVEKDPGPIMRPAVNLPQNNMVPNFYLSEEDNIILCGKVDWLEYLPESDSVYIIDFKTGKRAEKESSLQLPIYLLLVTELQKRPIAGASYWYLEAGEHQGLVEKELPEYADARTRVLETARTVKQAREDKAFDCPRGPSGCFACQPFEVIIQGDATYVGVNDINQDVYCV